MFPQFFVCGFYLHLLAGLMRPLCVPSVVLPHSRFFPIYEENVVTAVLVCVGIYVVLLQHIMSWSYPLFVSDNPTSVLFHNTSFQSSTHKLGIIPQWMKLSGRHILCLHTTCQNCLTPMKIIWGAICVSIVLVCVCIGNILWSPGVQWVNSFLGAPLGEKNTCPCKYPNKLIYFWLAATVYIAE